MMLLNLLLFCCLATYLRQIEGQTCTDSTIDYIANNLKLKFTVVNNLVWPPEATLTLTNVGTTDSIQHGNWEIYFTSLRTISFDDVEGPLKAEHVNGVLFKMYPTTKFPVLSPSKSVNVPITLNYASVARTDSLPNWYVVERGCKGGHVLVSTASLDLDFVSPYTAPMQWKRGTSDTYDPYTPQERFSRNDVGSAQIAWNVLPTPVSVNVETSNIVDVIHDGWVIVSPGSTLTSEANYLAAALNIAVVPPDQKPPSHTIELSFGDVSNPLGSMEAYILTVDAATSKITLTGNSPAGVFYAIQTLISLSYPDGEVPHITVTDWPRFPYRGHMIDVARNFHSGKEEIKTLLDGMAMYKLNRLHLHLGDDEGWRLEIPGLPELTEIGGRRCHDLDEIRCVIPQLGSGPTTDSGSGTGWYSVSDYQSILSYAAERHITVIPEFDMPGHAHAAIVSMLARYKLTGDTRYLLNDLNDTSRYSSVQGFTDNAINPCLDSTYAFIEHVMIKLVDIHRAIQKLTIFNLGGDEVAVGAWVNSTACNERGFDVAQAKLHFLQRVTELARQHGLSAVFWEDALYINDTVVPPASLANTTIYSIAWDSIWEFGTGRRAYEMANAGYKVILGPATHLYFDMPIEPDPEERGLYWATRFTSVKKAFSYQPDDVYNNIDLDRFGNKLNRTEVCAEYGCPSLVHVDNIVGMQCHVWSETMRRSSEYQSVLFPRLLALAERSWHKADWEQSASRRTLDDDWTLFANKLGHHELRRLDALGIAYRVPPPGARTDSENSHLEAVCETPGLQIRYSLDGVTWTNLTGSLRIDESYKGSTVTLVTMSANGARMSRQVTTSVNKAVTVTAAASWSSTLVSIVVMTAVVSL